MFKKNTRHFQVPLTSNGDELPPKLRKRLDTSWSGVFYQHEPDVLDATIPAKSVCAMCGHSKNKRYTIRDHVCYRLYSP
jgi:hypothetical protein